MTTITAMIVSLSVLYIILSIQTNDRTRGRKFKIHIIDNYKIPIIITKRNIKIAKESNNGIKNKIIIIVDGILNYDNILDFLYTNLDKGKGIPLEYIRTEEVKEILYTEEYEKFIRRNN